MEKVIRRSILRRNQLVKQARKDDLEAVQGQWRDYRRRKQAIDTQWAKVVANERKARREDWILGPLAPNRDAGAQKGKYGTLHQHLAARPRLPSRYILGPKSQGSDPFGREDRHVSSDREWRGEGLPGNVIVGDRVVVTRGRDAIKGKIGTVSKLEPESNSVYIEGINQADVEVPAFLLSTKDKFFTYELPVPMDDIRLVMQMEDPETGFNGDVIVDHVYGGPPYQERELGSNLPRHTRYIAGHDIEIPWPEADIEKQYTHECDTPRLEVEQVTYTPSIDHHPFGQFTGVIDELRSKYSRSRTSHDNDDWIMQKIVEDARQDWLESRSLSMSNQKPRTSKATVAERVADQLEGRRQLTSNMRKTLEIVGQMQGINLKDSARA